MARVNVYIPDDLEDQLKAAGTSFCADRSWRSLLKREVAAAGLAIETSSDICGVNRSAARAGVNAAFRAIDLNTSGTGTGADARNPWCSAW